MELEVEVLKGDPPRILIVEDEALIRLMIADALRDEGVTVIEASTADEALGHLGLDDPIDLVFTDHRMPGSMTGADLASRIREKWPNIGVVLTSGDFDGRAYPGKVLRKPYSVLDVAAELAKIARSKRWGILINHSSPVVLIVEGDIVVRHPLAEYLRS